MIGREVGGGFCEVLNFLRFIVGRLILGFFGGIGKRLYLYF